MIPKSFVVEDILISFRQKNAVPRLVKDDAMSRNTVRREALVLTETAVAPSWCIAAIRGSSGNVVDRMASCRTRAISPTENGPCAPESIGLRPIRFDYDLRDRRSVRRRDGQILRSRVPRRLHL